MPNEDAVKILEDALDFPWDWTASAPEQAVVFYENAIRRYLAELRGETYEPRPQGWID